jgi:putative autotransporter adhesin-like protein
MATRALNSALALSAILTMGCSGNVLGFQLIRGSGTVKEESRTVPDFTGVAVGNGIRATISVGPKAPIKISADDNLLTHIKTEVQNGRLIVRVQQGLSINTNNPISVTIATPQLENVDASGGSRVTAAASTTKRFEVDASGGSHVTVSGLDAELVKVDASGGSNLTLAGKGKSLTLDISGGTRVTATDFTAETAQINGSGGCQAELNASQAVKGDLSGGTRLRVLGSPATKSVSTSGGSGVSFSN